MLRKTEFVEISNTMVCKLEFSDSMINEESIKLSMVGTVEVNFKLEHITFLQEQYHHISTSISGIYFKKILEKINYYTNKPHLYKVSEIKDLIDDLPF